MKKSIIKRRKRVVPALRDRSPNAGSSNDSSVSPEMSSASLVSNHFDTHRYSQGEQTGSFGQTSSHMQSAYQSQTAPPAIDFTGYISKSLSLPHHGPRPANLFSGDRAAPGETTSSATPKKRTLDEANTTDTQPSPHGSDLPVSAHLPPINPSSLPNSGRLSSISSLLNHAERSFETSHIDPSLGPNTSRPQTQTQTQAQPQSQSQAPPSFPPSHAPASVSPAPSTTGPVTLSEEALKLERRAQLQQEAEKMREALRAKERELAALEP